MAAIMLVAGLGAPAWAGAPDDEDGPGGPDVALIAEAVEIIEERFVDAQHVEPEDLTEGALRGLVEALGDDGHTVYLTPDELRVEQDALDGRVSGIGVLVDRRAGLPIVIAVVDGSPADQAGLRSGDRLTTIDGTEIARLPDAELGELVRGEPGTTVRLGVERPGRPEPFEVVIVRRTVAVPPASWARVPGSGAALVRIVQFSSDSAREAVSAIEQAVDGGAEAIVLDLRGNPGGLVEEAVMVAGAFLREGTAYRARDREDALTEIPVRGRTVAPEIPVAVLVDYGTASSAEILAAALRDNGRATLVGERTFGTGTILNTFPLSDGSALRIGVLEWLTPDGDAVFRVGLTPDIVVAREAGSAPLGPSDLVGMAAAEVGESGDRQLLAALDVLGL